MVVSSSSKVSEMPRSIYLRKCRERAAAWFLVYAESAFFFFFFFFPSSDISQRGKLCRAWLEQWRHPLPQHGSPSLEVPKWRLIYAACIQVPGFYSKAKYDIGLSSLCAMLAAKQDQLK